jgi:hypothetical protein
VATAGNLYLDSDIIISTELFEVGKFCMTHLHMLRITNMAVAGHDLYRQDITSYLKGIQRPLLHALVVSINLFACSLW